MAAGLAAGRVRSFAFETLNGFDPDQLKALKARVVSMPTEQLFYGSDRNLQVVEMARENAGRAGVDCTFEAHPVSGLTRPEGPAGLVICRGNP